MSPQGVEYSAHSGAQQLQHERDDQRARELAAGLRTDGVERAVELLTAPAEPFRRTGT
jgi:hypothetical protein